MPGSGAWRCVTDAWAGANEKLSEIIFSGAETFSIAKVECNTRTTLTKQNSKNVTGKFIVGKDIGQYPQKYLLGG